MKKNSSLPLLSQASETLDIAVTKKIELMAKNYPGTISLAQGIPSFPTPKNIKDAAIEAIKKDLTGKYTPGFGIEPLREAIVKKVKRDNGITTKPSQVIVTHGAIEALMAIFLAVLNKGDEIIIPTPDYASHMSQVLIATGKKAVCVALDETKDDWELNIGKLEKAITKHTKAILVCNPCNPTGKVYSEKQLKEIAKIAIKHNLYIITDEMYEYFVFDGKKHISIGSFPEVADRTISIFGVSKSYAMTGWRIGYIVASQPLIDAIFKIHDSLVTCPAAVSQYAALAAISGPKTSVEHFKKEFIKRRKIVVDALKQTDKLTMVVPGGAYYAFPKFVKKINEDKLVVQLLDKARVAVIPGGPFGKGGENHIRISFGCEEDQLKEGLNRFVTYINKNL